MSDVSAAFSAPHVTKPRSRSDLERVDRVLAETLAGEDLGKLLKNLTEDELNLFYELIAELREHGDLDMEDLWKIDYIRKPPTMEEFISDPYWMAGVCVKSDESEGLFPEWQKVLCRDFNLDSRLHNAVITGSLGIGKSYITCLVILYRIVLARLLRNPQSFLGLSKGSHVLYVLISITKSAVAETIFGDALNFMANCPFFVEECKFKPEKKYGDLIVPLGNSLFLTAGSRGQHIIGRNTLGIAMDEGNWRLEANPDMRAYKLYDDVRTRLKNRFQKVSGYLPAISILASSAKDESSFTEQVITDVEVLRSPLTEKVYRYAVYEIKRHTLQLSDKWFRVSYGVKNMDPKVLSGYVQESGRPFPGEEALEEVPAGARVKLVPTDYLDSFKRNTSSALQSISGVSTGGTYRLFANTLELERAIAAGESVNLTNPAKLELIPLSDENDKELYDFLDHRAFITRRAGIYCPLRDPDAPRFAHFDLATTSQAGVAICHVVGNTLVDGVYNRKTGKVFSEYRNIVEYDLVLAIVTGDTKPISLQKIQNLFFWLRDKCGFRFAKITADTYQSAMALQILETRGFDASVLSIDRTKGPYYAWRDGFNEGRIRTFRHHTMLREAENLVDGQEKVDHPEKGSKDVTDACAGAYYDAITYGGKVVSPGGQAVGLSVSGKTDDTESPPIDLVPPEPIRDTRRFTV